ncbi:CaiB/BaiF CoA transferase family protein [Nonomuraea glycinis]|uniref:CaiB/BaiF CoA transferase family protein n=1 Tax=Nonomuraea glycinis TaxID=2047744 RepID=UPI0033AEA476
MTHPLPLSDVRVIAVEQFGAGPFGTMHLADLGADVIKIEDPSTGGDVSRHIPPFQEENDSLFFETFNRNKRSIALDLSSPAGREVFEALVARSDAVYSNLRGDVPERLGITYEQLKHLNPRLVCVSLSGYGMTGPRRAEPGYDYIMQGIAGWMSITGEPGGPPTKSGLSIVDFCGGLVAGQALLAGVLAARRDGVGMDCDLSLYDTALAMLTYPATWHLTGGFTPTRRARSAHPSLVPFQNFRTADGWLVVACPKEKFYARMTEAIDAPEIRDDPRFADFDGRLRHEEELLPLLDAAFASRSTAAWLARLGAAGVPCGPINTVAEALTDPQAVARGLVVETEHPRFGVVRQVGSPVRVGPGRTEHRRGPQLGEDSDDVLRELLEYDDEAVLRLGAAGAFGPPA